MHEVIGHASGKIEERLKGNPQAVLKEQFSALEEARADLVALWDMGDPDLIAAGAVEAKATRRAAYKQYVMKGLADLRRVRSGDTIGEDHLRASHLIVEFARSKGAVERVTRDGKSFDRITGEDKFHDAAGELLAEIMRAKAEGDYAAGKHLIETWGSRFDPKLRDEIVARAASAGVPVAYRYMSPRLVPVKDASGVVTDVTLAYGETLVEQELRYSGP